MKFFRYTIFCMLCLPRVSFAQDASVSNQAVASTLEDIVEREAEKVLSRVISPDDFYLTATVEPLPLTETDVPYMTSAIEIGSLSGLPIAQINKYVRKITLNVFVHERHGKDTVKFIQDILDKKLNLSKARGDSVKFKTLKIVKGANAEVARQTESKVAEQALVAPQDAGANGETPAWLAQLKKPKFLIAGLSLILALVLIPIIAFSMVFMRFSNKVGNSFVLLGESMRQAAEVVGSHSTETISLPASPVNAQIAEQNSRAIRSVEGRELPDIDVAKLSKELHALISPQNEWVLSEYISSNLEHKEFVSRAIAALELVGKDRSQNIFEKLSSGNQALLIKALNQGQNSDRGSAAVFVAEELRTKLMADSLASNQAQTLSKLSEQLSLLDADKALSVCLTLEGDLLARFLYHLAPDFLSKMLKKSTQENEALFATISDALLQVPVVAKDASLDGKLLKTVEKSTAVFRNDVHQQYLGYYQQIIESVDDRSADRILQSLESNENLSSSLKRMIIRLEDFFQATEQVRNEVLANLSNREIAALCGGFSEEQKDLMISWLGERRRDTVEEEILRLEAKPQLAKNAAFNAAKTRLLDVFKKLQNTESDGSNGSSGMVAA